jgi:hypothetical protein
MSEYEKESLIASFCIPQEYISRDHQKVTKLDSYPSNKNKWSKSK